MVFQKGDLNYSRIYGSSSKGRTNENCESRRKASEKTSITKKRLFAEGKLIPSTLGKHLSEETRLKIGLANKGKLKGTKFSEEHKQKIAEKLTGENNGMFGIPCTAERKEKMIKSIFKRKEQFGYINSPEARKKLSAALQGIPLEEWKKFVSFEPYTEEFNKSFKNSIRKRDNQICMNCGIHREKVKRTFPIHHINYNKMLSIPQNCISLCENCHGLTCINRSFWTKLFQEKLSKLYDYKYDEKGNVVLNLMGVTENE